MIDRIVHHADVLTLKGNSYRLRNIDIGTGGFMLDTGRVIRLCEVAGSSFS
jgi:hypothetical protein